MLTLGPGSCGVEKREEEEGTDTVSDTVGGEMVGGWTDRRENIDNGLVN